MGKSRTAILNDLRLLQKEIQSTIIDKSIEKLTQLLLEWYNDPTDIKYHKFEKALIEAIENNILEKVYSLTSKRIKQIYGIPEKVDLPISKIVYYNKDGQELKDRLRRWFSPKKIKMIHEGNEINPYWDEEDNLDFIQDKLSAISKLITIIDTEAVNQKNKTMYDKLHKFCEFVIIENDGCGDICQAFTGEWPIDEYPDPPFHPHCDCIPVYEITDEWDEIQELSLEDDTEDS